MELKMGVIIVGTIIGLVLLLLLLWFFKNKKKEFILSLFSITFTLILLEIILALFLPQINEHKKMFQYDSKLGWTFVPNKKGQIIFQNEVRHSIETNSRGFRDNPVRKKPSNAKSILVIGDSFVSNISVDSEEVFTELIQTKLDDYEVLNFGVNGYGQVQEFLMMKDWQNEIQPDILIVMIYIRNDFTDNTERKWLYNRPIAKWNEKNESIIIEPALNQINKTKQNWKLYQKSHLYNLLRRKILNIITKFSLDTLTKNKLHDFTPPELYLCHNQQSTSTNVLHQTMQQLLLKFETHAKEKGIPLVFALAPSIFQVEDKKWLSLLKNEGLNPEEYSRTLPNDRLMKFAKTNGLNMVDLLPILRSETKKELPLYFAKEQHWTKEGNRVVANYLLNYLDSNSLISTNKN
jgi:hypothetical protein